MTLSAARAIAVRSVSRKAPVQQQKRTIVDYLTNYPDKVAEMKKVQCAGGTLQGESNPTWTKQPSDKFVNAAGFLLASLGFTKATIAAYRLATGKGKIED
ncbi:unnamed protein product [Cylindrotheca closterium]|uniref:Uncharacterized protein n=1 Tax=Cylindrotheca closterium TaxID=2856 RepID=A0AAD2FUA9_9STRA|nr:unnamed protein product [Cylindrotheca closterium]